MTTSKHDNTPKHIRFWSARARSRENVCEVSSVIKNLIIFGIDVIMVAISNQFRNIMARTKRIALSVDPEYHELLTKLAEHQNKTVTNVVTDFLEASKPMAIAMNQAFEDLKVGKDLVDVQQKLFAEGLKAASEQLNKD